MEGEKQRYKVQAFSKRFIILTKPFNARKTYLYSIVDLERKVRGRDNLVFGFIHGYNNKAGASKAIKWLEAKETEQASMEVSYRHFKPLEESEIEQLTKWYEKN